MTVEKLLRNRALPEAARSKLRVEWQIGVRLDARYELRFPISSSKGDPQGKQPPPLAWNRALELYPRQLASA